MHCGHLSDPIEIQEVASRLLGEQLHTDRVFYSEMDEARGQLIVERDFVREGTAEPCRLLSAGGLRVDRTVDAEGATGGD